MEILTDKIRGCLVGGAIGDALGYSVEFMTYPSIIRQYGSDGITSFTLEDNLALFSDDTQMTLFTANGLLNGIVRNNYLHRQSPLIDNIGNAYIDWYKTQLRQNYRIPENERNCWISGIPQLYALRAPGNTCLTAIQQRINGSKVENNSKGCGGIMRIAPIALAFDKCPSGNAQEIFNYQSNIIHLACKAARLTHLHPLGFLPAGLMAFLLYKILHSPDAITPQWIKSTVFEGLWYLDNTVDSVRGVTHKQLYHKELDELNIMTLRTVKLAEEADNDVDAIKKLGQGWTADEAWYIALYCCIRHLDSVHDAIIAAVNHDGDSDSTGAIAGNIMGAIHGYQSIKSQNLFCPAGHKLETTLELLDVILTISDDLAIVQNTGQLTEPEILRLLERYSPSNH